MTFAGILPGLKPLGWSDCEAKLAGFVISGSAPTVQPSNPTGTNYARFLDLGNGTILFQFQFVFDANSVFGTGDHIWAVKLPRTANRSNGGADLSNGTVLAWQGSSASPQLNMALRPTLMDPMLFGGNQGFEDDWIQFFCPYLLSMGTFTLPGSNGTSVTVAHGLGSTPSAFDFDLTLTNTASTAPGAVFIDTITSTNFNVNVRAGSTTTPQQGAWKCRMEPNGVATLDVLANHTRPWLWASGHQLSGTIVYEART